MTSAHVALADAGVATQGSMFVPLSPRVLPPSAQGGRVEVMLEKEAGVTQQKKVRGGDQGPPFR